MRLLLTHRPPSFQLHLPHPHRRCDLHHEAHSPRGPDSLLGSQIPMVIWKPLHSNWPTNPALSPLASQPTNSLRPRDDLATPGCTNSCTDSSELCAFVLVYPKSTYHRRRTKRGALHKN